MNPWINDDIFKTWTEAQRRLWDSLCSAVPFQPPAGVEAWRETYLKNLATWEAAVRQTLAQEATWVRQWVQRVANDKDTPEPMTTWAHQMEDVLQRWLQTQNQWWDEYFGILRHGGILYPERTRPAPVASAVVVEPASATPQRPIVDVVHATVGVTEAANETLVEPVADSTVSVTVDKPTVADPEPAITPEAIPPVTATPAPAQPDDLKLISGIGPALEKKLNNCGILSFRQLALLSEQEIDRIDATIKAMGRIRRDDWIGQARQQHQQKYNESI